MSLVRVLSFVGIAALVGCSGSDGTSGTNGTNGTNGTDGVSCSVADNGDGTKTITCDDGTVVVTDGADGVAGDDCTVVDNGDGTKTITCGTATVTVTDGDDAIPGTPTLEGHTGQKGNMLGYDVQAAFNDDTMFVRVTYRGNEGKRHQYLRYDGTDWIKEGGDRRDAQGSIDLDTDQGDQKQVSTIYEQRSSIMWNDPNTTPNVTEFSQWGCYLTCHDDSRHMPEWNAANGHDGKWVDPAHVTGYAAETGDKVLDLWHWRGARSNPIAMADDQYIWAIDWPSVTRTDKDNGGRKGDGGQSVFFNQDLDGSGNPAFLLDPATTWGSFTFPWEQFWQTPFYYMTTPDAASMGHTTPNPTTIPYADAVAAGYTPQAGDTVPRRILRPGAGSRADISAHGTTFTPESPDGRLGVWRVQMQRALTNGNDDDVQLVAGNTYDVGFEVHLWEYTTRDHYVSFPMTLSLGTGGDIEAVDLRGASGNFPLPDWNNTDAFPVKRVYLFQPGINSWEFLSGQNSAKVFTDPVTGLAVDQAHGGAGAVAGGTGSCIGCHTVRKADVAGPGQSAGSMEELSGQRGGVWTDTPTDAP